MNYFADHEEYPYAGSHEFRNDAYNPPRYEFHIGWIAWVRGDTEIDPDEEKDSTKSKAKHYRYVGCGIDDDFKDVQNSIRYGSLFDYVRSDYSCYFCKQFNNGKGDARRTFAMNNFFGSRTNPRGNGVKTRDLSWGKKEASRLALFIELSGTSGASGAAGYSGTWGEGASQNLADDSSWDWDKEDYGAWHKKGKDYFGHVVFLDGHVESILSNNKIREKSEMLGRGGIE